MNFITSATTRIGWRVAVRSSRRSYASVASLPVLRRTSTLSHVVTPLSACIRYLSDSSSSGSHSDFAPQKKAGTVESTEAALKVIDEHVKKNPVMLYMKGTPNQPMCGFSAKVINILKQEEVDYGSVNVLDYPMIRDSVKQYSEWPTIPQLYVAGEFVGGCDIISDLHKSGELAEMLKPIKEKSERETDI